MRPLRLLLVEASTETALIDELTLEETFAQKGVPAKVLREADGAAALRYLDHTENLPDLVVIRALEVCDVDGCRLIGLLKSSTLFRSIPIVMLGVPAASEAIERAFLGGCAGYFVRAEEYGQFHEDLTTIAAYWHLSQRPHHA